MIKSISDLDGFEDICNERTLYASNAGCEVVDLSKYAGEGMANNGLNSWMEEYNSKIARDTSVGQGGHESGK